MSQLVFDPDAGQGEGRALGQAGVAAGLQTGGKEQIAGEFTDEKSLDSEVTYSFEQDGKFFLIERMPARVCSETGEQYSPPKPLSTSKASSKTGRCPKRRSKLRFTNSFDTFPPYFTSSHWLALWLLNSGAYMLWMFAMPDW